MAYVESITARNETRTIRDLNGQQMLATIEASTTASKAYAVGDYLILNDKVYKVTTAIASGGTITVGTNVTETKVGAELSELNRQISESITPAIEEIETALDGKAPVIINTASGEIASFADGADGMPVKSLVANIEPVQEGSGDPSPDNIRPISGHTGASVTRTGKNLLENKKVIRASAREILIGQDTTSGYPIFLKAGITYTISNNLGRPCYYQISGTTSEIACNGTFSVNADCFVKIWVYLATDQTIDSLTWWQLEIGSTATSYEPYTGNTLSITFPSSAGTVYGGTLDVISGVLTVDRVMKRLEVAENLSGAYPGSLIWNKQGQSIRDADTFRPFICNRLKYVGYVTTSSDWQYGACINANGTSFNLWLKDSAFASLADATAWLAENETQLCYYIATPQSYQLTPQQLNTLLGSNNIYSDVGSVTVQYPADTKLYIDGKIAEAIANALNA